MTPLTEIQIIDETIKFYSEDTSRRATIAEDGCAYNTSDGRHCAVGRCLLPKYQERGAELSGNSNGVDNLIKLNHCSNIDEMLQEQYRGHNNNFWNRLQSIHDDENNWLKNDISENGIIRVNNLKETYQNQ